jgi:hypothetical protein
VQKLVVAGPLTLVLELVKVLLVDILLRLAALLLLQIQLEGKCYFQLEKDMPVVVLLCKAVAAWTVLLELYVCLRAVATARVGLLFPWFMGMLQWQVAK